MSLEFTVTMKYAATPKILSMLRACMVGDPRCAKIDLIKYLKRNYGLTILEAKSQVETMLAAAEADPTLLLTEEQRYAIAIDVLSGFDSLLMRTAKSILEEKAFQMQELNAEQPED